VSPTKTTGCPPTVKPDGLREWATRTAASLPPFTTTEAMAAGQIAAAIDARRHEVRAV
jgi:hypothetical protein